MNNELDYIIESYSALRLSGASALKDISLNSPSKLRSPQKESSKIIRSSPFEIYKLCMNTIDICVSKLLTPKALDSSYLKLVSSCFTQLYRLNIEHIQNDIKKKHQYYIIKLIEIESSLQTNFEVSLFQVRLAYLKNTENNTTSNFDVLSTDAPLTLKFLTLQIIFKKFQSKNYDNSAHILDFLLNDDLFLDKLSRLQKSSLVKLTLSLAKSAPSPQFKQCMNLKFLQLLIQLDLNFEDFIYNMNMEQFLRGVESKLAELETHDKVPFFLFSYGMVDSSQRLLSTLELYKTLLSSNPKYSTIQWELVVPNPVVSERLLSLIKIPTVNNLLLQDELSHLANPNATIIEKLGEYLISSSFKADLHPIIMYYLLHINSFTKTNLHVLDKLVTTSDNFIKHPSFLEEMLSQLSKIFSKFKSYKRLKNISNLFYNFSSRISDSNFCVSFIIKSIETEFEVMRFDCDNSDISIKIEKSIRLLLASNLDVRGVYRAVFNNANFQLLKGSNILEKLDHASFILGSKLLYKELKLLDIKSLSEENKAIIFCLASKSSKDDLSTFFQKLSIKDSLLQMCCGVFYDALPLFKLSIIRHGPGGHQPQLLQVESLIRTFYYLTQEMKTKSTSNLRKIVLLYTNSWLVKSKGGLTSFEFSCLKKLVGYLKFNGYFRASKKLFHGLEKYKSLELIEFNNWVSFEKVHNSLCLKEDVHLSSRNIDLVILEDPKETANDHLIMYLNILLLKVEFHLLNFNITEVIETSNIISGVIGSNRATLSIQNELNLPKSTFITILKTLVVLHLYSAKVLSLLGKHMESIVSAKSCIQLSRTLIKNGTTDFDVIKSISSGFRNIIKTLIHIGVTKDANYYIKELIRFNDTIARYKSIYSQNCYFISYFYFICGRENDCLEFKMQADDGFASLCLMESGEYHDNLNLVFFHIVSDIYLSNGAASENVKKRLLDLFSFVERENCHSDNWKQYFKYYFKVELPMRTNDNPFIKVMESITTARTLFFDAQSSLNTDPLFSSLEDSAMSIPAIIKQNEDIKRPSTSRSKSRGFKNLTNSIINLKKSKDLIMDSFDKLNYLSNHHIDETHKIFALNLLTLSGISSSRVDGVISELYKLNDYSKNEHLLNEKRLVKILNSAPNAVADFCLNEIGSSITELNKFPDDILDRLPKDWLIITIDICSLNGDLIISKFEEGQSSPYLLRLPLSRHSSRTMDEESFSFESALIELRSIIKQSNATTSKERTSSINTSEQRREWHQERHELDENLRLLLEKIEYCWLGGFKGIFNQEKISNEYLSAFKDRLLSIIRQNAPSRQKNGKHVEIDNFVVELFLKLGDPSKILNTEIIEDLIYYVLDILLFHGDESSYDEVDIDSIYVQIENLINEYILANPNPLRNKHTVLVLGKECHEIPWESLPCLRSSSVVRMPSLSHLLKLYEGNKELVISKSNGSYLLNPSGELIRTEERLKHNFHYLRDSYDWKGLASTAPTEKEFESFLKDSNLFIYAGHGGGEQFIRCTTLKKMDSIAPTLLLGCSSAVLQDNRLLEPSGTAYSYLIGGCPMIVGMLWDVTDKDIDAFSGAMLSKWGLIEKEPNSAESMEIGKAIAQSRDECKLKYLNGAAPIIYGLPLSLV